LVADGKGILAADETAPTLSKRFDILGIASTEQSRRTYREMLFTSPGVADFISGTIRQKTSEIEATSASQNQTACRRDWHDED
jgi:fructose-bisphosphate aldolase class I